MEHEHFPQKLNVWGAIGIFGTVAIHVYERNMDSGYYIKTMEEYLIPNADEIYGCRTLQQDNAGVHTSHELHDWFHKIILMS